MKLFFCEWTYGYGTGSCVIQADNLDRAHEIAKNCDVIWPDYVIHEIQSKDKYEGVLYPLLF